MQNAECRTKNEEARPSPFCVLRPAFKKAFAERTTPPPARPSPAPARECPRQCHPAARAAARPPAARAIRALHRRRRRHQWEQETRDPSLRQQVKLRLPIEKKRRETIALACALQ